MLREDKLLSRLDQQIANIEQFIIDLQKDRNLQQIFYQKKLYHNLNNIFKNNYTEYTKYFEDILADYKVFKKNNTEEFKLYYLTRIEQKIFALFKILRNLKKYNKNSDSLASKITQRQQQVNSLLNEKSTLEKMFGLLEAGYNNLNKQLLVNKAVKADNTLNKKIIDILAKKGKIERELFSVKERLRLLDYSG